MIPAFVYYVAAALGAAFFVWAGYGWFAWPSFGGGAAFLLWYGSLALHRAWRPQALLQDRDSGPRSRRAVLMAALAVTLLNPHVYLDTVLLIGSLGAQQPVPGAYALGAASASLIWFFTLALGAAWLAPWLARPTTWRLLDLSVAAMMFAVAWQLLAQAPQV